MKYIILFLALVLVSCDSKEIEKEFAKKQKVKDIKLDTIVNIDKIAYFQYKENQYIFENSSNYDLTNQDLKEIEVILINGIIEYNEAHKDYLRNFNEPDINLKNYKRQYVAVINSKNEKEVWINCICDNYNNNWKTQITYVEDGGNCFFNLKINLTKKIIYDFMVNGVA